ncbi:MAG: ribosome maturation factor RimP [Desulfovibrio sp.]|nr:ribosome maturation factor RimP [Desulfovibrio sp.]
MPSDDLRERIRQLALPLVTARGLVLWGLELVMSQRPLLRLYIDTQKNQAEEHGQEDEEAKTVADLQQCEEISRDLGLALDVENIFSGPWQLEVSTPGLSRIFFTLEQMADYLGEVVEARLFSPLSSGTQSRRMWRGKLTEVTESSFFLEPCAITEDDQVQMLAEPVVCIPWTCVRKVNRVALFPKTPKPGKKAARKKA